MAQDVGRPTVFEAKYIDQAFKFGLLGLTNEEVAEAFDVATSTVYEWMKTYPEFSEALKRGRKDADAHVAKSLYRQALRGNVAAQIFWLKNRQRQHWKPDSHLLIEDSPDGSRTIRVINAPDD